MPDRPLRWVHASDLHLERPLQGLVEVPAHLRELFLEAPYLAAEQVFETVLAEEVDFLVLAGDIVDPRMAGPRAGLFLAEYFGRLAERNIHVYWAESRTDAVTGQADPGLELDTVHRFARNRIEQFVHQRGNQPVARIVGWSEGGTPPPAGRPLLGDVPLPTIGVGYGSAAARALAPFGADYLALGGKHASQQDPEASCCAHYPGSPQGRCPRETGPHGCTVVELRSSGGVSTNSVTTDVMRWVNERVEAAGVTDRADLTTLLARHMDGLLQRARGVDLLVSWAVAAVPEGLRHQLRHGGLDTALLDELRQRYGHTSPAAWSVSLAADLPAAPPAESVAQESILADFLRVVREYQVDQTRPLDLTDFLPAALRSDPLLAETAVPIAQIRHRVLDQAGWLGAELLGHGPAHGDEDCPGSQEHVQ